MSFEESVKQYKQTIEAALEGMLAPDKTQPSKVLDAMRYSLLGGGKRVRGVLTMAACQLVSGKAEPALPAACAIEMLHCYSLIHDDLPAMDDDNLRRGQPSCHIQYDEATAILAGDALLTLAFDALARLEDARAAVDCVALLAHAAGHQGMVLGQEMDIAAQELPMDAGQIAVLHALKTGALLRAAAGMGAMIGGAKTREIDALCQYAENLGLAFQAVDDVLDVTSDADILGKPVGSDVLAHKQTGAVVHGVTGARALAEHYTNKAISALAGFQNAEFLIELAYYLLKRDR